MPTYSGKGENVTVVKPEPAVTQCRNNLKTEGNLTVKDSMQDFDAKEMYLHPANQSAPYHQSRSKRAIIPQIE